MTRDDIISMAREAGFAYSWSEEAGAALERFAALVAAAEREACAKVCEAQRDAKVERHPARVEYTDNFMALQCAAAVRTRT